MATMPQPCLLVTGHLGFIGSGFTDLYAKEYRIIGVDFRGWGSMIENLTPGVTDIQADIADSARMQQIMDEHRPKAIIRFAAESHVDRSIESDLGFWHSNVLGTRVLALAAHARKIRLVHVSTDEVYGDADENSGAWTETTPMNAKNPYSVTKSAAE